MTRSLKALFLALSLFALAACTSRTLLQPDVQLAADRQVGQVELQQVIVTALEARRWQVDKVEPTQILASINVRQRHQAWIAVDYSALGYQIRYRDSRGLDYEDGEIHRNYNRWIKKLNADIQRQLKTL